MIPYGHQSISQADIDAVDEVLRSDWLTQGPAVPRFEGTVAQASGATFAVACSNGTAALHIAALAAGLGPGDLLWTVPNTFVASANCARYCGADVGFVDIDEHTHCIDVSDLEARLERADRSGRLPSVVVPVDFAGLPCEMARVRELADRYGFTVIEDAAHALGATYRGTPVGSGAYAHMTTLSFHPVKLVTTGEGGMVLTESPDLDGRLRLFRNHGITRDRQLMEVHDEGAWYYEQVELGYNYRLTDIQAALGASQMDRLETFLDERRRLAERYDELLDGLPLALPPRSEGSESAWHLYVVRVPAVFGRSRLEVFDSMRQAGIGVNVHYIPVHLQPYYRRLGFGPGDFPAAERYYSEALTLPLYPGLTDAEQESVAVALRDALR